MDHETLATLRYCIQRVLVPCVVIIGVLGNFISVIVLTRKRMRCSTNIYLTALAVADIIYLIFVFILSLQHYPNINLPKYKIYWSTIGLSHWFCDATTYTSIYLTVSFTIERYIAVCHPIRGQVLCTESRAKRVIAAVVILCFLLTITTAFEHKLIENPKHININTFEPCIPNVQIIDDSLREQNNDSIVMLYNNQSTFLNNDVLMNTKNDISKRQTIEKNGELQQDIDKLNITDGTSVNDMILDDRNKSECELSYFISHGSSDLANNTIYTDIFFYFTSIFFIFLPLILIATFNSFLIRAVHQSHKLRDQMTNTRPNHTSSSAQENKVTITLIAVVILFIICQTPTAIYLIFKIYNAISPNIEYALGNFLNFLVTLNASCNFLLYCALSNKYRKTVKQLFMGQKVHRKCTRSGIDTTSRYTSSTRATSCYSKDFSTHFGGGGPGGGGGGALAINNSGHTNNNNKINIRNRAQQPRRFSVTPTDYNNLQIAVGLLNPGKMNDSPKSTTQIANSGSTKSRKNSEQLGIPMNVIKHSSTNQNNENKNQNDIINNSISSSSNNNNNNSNNNINSNNNNNKNGNNIDNNSNSVSSSSIKPSCSHLFLKPSPSQTSLTLGLTRSRSLILPTKTKHSPHCKDNPNNF